MGNNENWVSFVDLLIISSIVLCLIISLSSYSESTLSMELPQMKEITDKGLTQIQTLTITIKNFKGGIQYYLEEKPLSSQKLRLTLEAIKPKAILLRAEKNMVYEDILELIHFCKTIGVKSLSFGYIRS